MNLLLLEASDFVDSAQNRVRLSGRRLDHISSVIKGTVGTELKVGLRNGSCGTGILTMISSESADIDVTLDIPPPSPLPLTLVCALPRPKSFKKAVATATSLGIKEMIFIESWRVEKSYWQSPVLKPDAIEEQIVAGLEQARDTVFPNVSFKRRFKPFAEDELPSICSTKKAFVAHPYDASPCPFALQQNAVLVIGPEGGFIPYEIELLRNAGCLPVTIGERILRVETAIAAFAARFW